MSLHESAEVRLLIGVEMIHVLSRQ